MSDLPISQLPEATTPIASDLLAIIVDNDTIPVSKKITYGNFQETVDIKTVTRVVSDNLRWSNDAERSHAGTVWTLLKEIKLNEDLSVCRIKYSAKSSATDENAYSIIRKNDVVIGTQRINTTTGYVEYSEDFTGFVKDDLIQIWVKNESVTTYAYNFRFYFDRDISEIESEELETPLILTTAFETDPTNQDPA